MSRKLVMNLTNYIYFIKTVSQLEFDYGLFKKSPRIIAAYDFSAEFTLT